MAKVMVRSWEVILTDRILEPMDFIEYFTIAVLLGLAWLWLDSLRAREIGLRAAARACSEEGVQFLDETVVSRSLRPVRDDDGRLRLRRVYAFEYSDTGDNRREGSISLVGHEVELINVRPHLFVVPRAEPPHETLH